MKTTKKNQANPMWGGHFDVAPSDVMQEINQSISFDKLLYAFDIEGSIAHASMLAKKKIISNTEAKEIISGLTQIKQEFDEGKITFDYALEDIHMHVESRLKELIGDIAGKLHTARSRNDQVATDFKLFVRHTIDTQIQLITSLQDALIQQASKHIDTIMPGFTHLQTAQPVSLAHHLLAYVEMFARDVGRLKDTRKRLNECPLGAAALAGTSFPIDRKLTAKTLGFDGPTHNSIDSVSDRDFALEYLSAASIITVHLSRFSEELVIWSSAPFSFVKLSDAYTTGSSIMPQKRNPDAAELIRAKTGRVFGNLTALLSVMKGLPLTYSKDMQEDKEPVFDTATHLELCLRAMTGMVSDLSFNKDSMLTLASSGYSTATDIADWLVQNLNIPFRQCHHITGKIVKKAESKSCQLGDLSLKELQAVEPGITKDIYKVLDVYQSAKSRQSYGGTSPLLIKKAIRDTKKRLGI